MRIPRRWPPLLFGLVLVACSHPSPELTVRERTVNDTNTIEATSYYTADKTVSINPRQRTIVDLGAKTVTMIDLQSKSYAVTSFDDMRKQGEAMRQRFESAPPEQRERLTGGDPAVTTTPTGRSETIAGHEAKEYTIEVGPVSGQVWVAESITVPASKPTWDKESAAIRAFARPVDRYADAMAALPGLVLRRVTTITSGDRKSVTTTEVVELSAQGPPPEALVVPEGFNKVNLPGFGG